MRTDDIELDKDYYEQLFEDAICNRETKVITLFENNRRIGKTTILNNVSNLCQITYGFPTIFITPYVKQEHITNQVYTSNNFCRRHGWANLPEHSVVFIDEIQTNKDEVDTVIGYLGSRQIPVVGFISPKV